MKYLLKTLRKSFSIILWVATGLWAVWLFVKVGFLREPSELPDNDLTFIYLAALTSYILAVFDLIIETRLD